MAGTRDFLRGPVEPRPRARYDPRVYPVLPLRTPRLILRALRATDASMLAAYRNDPEVARYQDWPLPYTDDRAAEFIAEQGDASGPRPAAWTQIGIDQDGLLIGDLAVGLDGTGKLAMLGYTLCRDRQGQGLATEAAGALIDALFEGGLHRVAATLDPANIASAMLLERLGFRYEGRALQAAFVRGAWEDDDRYAILREERVAWLARPLTPPNDVRLVEVTAHNRRAVARLATHPSQERFVAPMARTFQHALIPEDVNGVPVVPWFRAIEADGEIVGFLMIAAVTSGHPRPFLWRLLIDRGHQGRGIGRRAVALLVDLLRSDGQTELEVSWHDGRGGPEGFYLKLGFVPTGQVVEGEHQAVLQLRSAGLS